MKFKTKAQNLKNLKIKSAIIPKLVFFTVKEYKKNHNKYINKIQRNFKSNIAIRSSSGKEDSTNKSFAGYFDSFLNINTKNKDEIIKNINKVILSLKKNSSKNDEILIQQMVKNPKISGVITTADKDTGSPYHCINYSISKDTSLVTSGKKGTKTFYFYKNSKNKPKNIFIKKIINAANELNIKFNNDYLDIEFILDEKLKLYIVQVRPIVIKHKKHNIKIYDQSLQKLQKKIHKLQKNHHDLLGNTTAFGVMPDWNPAEIIGYKPRPLALSLYQELITNHVWSEQRKNYGYRDISSNHLMVNFFGTPYVDVRVDFNSWLPSSLNENLAKKLVNFYIGKFKNNKSLHDKVEFEILFTCYTPSVEKKIKSHLKKSFSPKEIKQIIYSLKNINIYSFENLKDDYDKINVLKEKQIKIQSSNMYYIDKIYWLVEDCKKYGTLPFAGLARNAFVATDIIKSMIKENIITSNQVSYLLNNIKTITSNIFEDSVKLRKKRFLNIYGHLRPNTYEITSNNYTDGYKNYFGKKININKKENKKLVFNNLQKKKINIFLKKINKKLTFNTFLNYISESIRMREYSKFVFTKSIDLIFKNLTNFGKRLKLNKNDLSYLSINGILDLYYNLSFNNLEKTLKNESIQNKKDYKLNFNLKLPEVINNPIDVFFYQEAENKINYVGNSNISSEIYYLKNLNIGSKIIENKIVCIESADPGYDFIFLSNISGLITKYGGVNSHMSVRCSELNIPAAIGVGETKFNKIINNKKINLDCLSKNIKFIS